MKSRHKYDGRLILEFQLCCLTSHQFGELVVHNLHHQLPWLHSGEHIHAKRFLLNGVGELLCHLIVYVSVEQCTAHVFKRLRDIYFGYLTFALQYLKRAFKPIT